MYQQLNKESVEMILRNPNLWSEGMIDETLRRFKKSSSCRDSDLDPHNAQQLIRNYFLTLSKAMGKKDSIREDKKNEDRSSDLNYFFLESEYDLHYVEDNMMGIAWCDIVFK